MPAFALADDDPFVPYWSQRVADLTRAARVTVFALRRPYPGQGAPIVQGAHVVRIGDNPPLRRTPGLWRSSVSAIAEVHRRESLDVIHAWQAAEAGFTAVVAATRLRLPAMVHVGGGELVGLPRVGYGSNLVLVERLQVALALAGAAAVTTGCRAMAALTDAHPVMAARGRRAHGLPFGVDRTRFSPSPLPDRPTLLNVADLNPVKGHSTLLSAVAIAAAELPDLSLHLVGGGALAGRLRRQAEQLGIAARIHWWGGIPQSVVHHAFGRASAFVQSSFHEAQGVALLEAAASGLPVAATAVGLAAELPSSGAHLAPVGDPSALARVIREAMVTPIDDARAAMRRFTASYDRVATAEIALALYRDVIASARGAMRLRSTRL